MNRRKVTDPGMIAQILSILGGGGPGGLRLPEGTKWVDLYIKPVLANWGANRICRLRQDECRVEFEGRVYLFFNKMQNQLKLFFQDEDGDQMATKVIERGGFMLPVADA